MRRSKPNATKLKFVEQIWRDCSSQLVRAFRCQAVCFCLALILNGAYLSVNLLCAPRPKVETNDSRRFASPWPKLSKSSDVNRLTRKREGFAGVKSLFSVN